MDRRWKHAAWVSALLLFAVSACNRRGAPTDPVEDTLKRSGIAVKRVLREPDGTYVLDLSESDLADLSPLKGLPISSLDLHRTAVSDLSPLRGMPLKSLILCRSKVNDLGPLEGMPLETLKVSHTQVRDLSPLKGAPLKTLWIHETRVTDLGPLASMRLTELRFSPASAVAGLGVLRGMETLVWINQMPAATFWRRRAVEAQEPAPPRW